MKKILYVIFCCVFLITSCNTKTVFEETVDIPNGIWNMDTLVKLSPEIIDINSPYNIYLQIRNTNLYPSQNLWLFIKTQTPSGKIQTDTFECMLADDKGKWLGDGMGDLFDIEIPFRQDIGFLETGKYTIEIQHGMRIENLPFIMSVGIKIEKATIPENK